MGGWYKKEDAPRGMRVVLYGAAGITNVLEKTRNGDTKSRCKYMS